MTVEVMPARPEHIGPIVKSMGANDLASAAAAGIEPNAAVRILLSASSYCRVAAVSGYPIAMWGVVGPLCADRGEVWLVATDAMRRLPFTMTRIALAELRAMLETKTALTAALVDCDARAIRFMRFVGFAGHSLIESDGRVLPRGVLRRN
jgi:hypothetical protein